MMASSSASASAPSASPSSSKVCFNSNCKGAALVLPESDINSKQQPQQQQQLQPALRKGWRRRTGEFADLCDRCACAYEEGKFCETFHQNASGWRCCESCGKQIHCGCIVSFHTFVLLDAGGIECITCARKSFILTPNPAWPPPSHFLPLQPESIKDLSVKNWNPIAGSGPVPWRQAPSLFNNSSLQTEFRPRMPFEVNVSGNVDRLRISEMLCAPAVEKKKKEDSFERLMNGSLTIDVPEMLDNGSAGLKYEEQTKTSTNGSLMPSFPKNDPSTPNQSFDVASTNKAAASDLLNLSTNSMQKPVNSPATRKQICNNDPAAESHARNGKARGDARGKNQLLPRYWPRITDQELQQLSGDSNSVITPLFEKMLSASDAGRIGRLVLPKKCAEAYFPPISHPEGLPLRVQDLKGQEWVFQFRFWPNNNSRMYVLEGVTPCIQSMQLQAGDIVTFSRIEPEGKLVMGCRKASTAPSADKANEGSNAANGAVTDGNRSTKPAEVVTNSRPSKGGTAHGSLSNNQAAKTNSAMIQSVDKPCCAAKDMPRAKPSVCSKRKNVTLGSKSKRLQIEDEDMMELKVSWEQVQGLMRPAPNDSPAVVVIEGLEFEEFEYDAPVIGRPTIPGTDNLCGEVQWVQCEECFKWRKLPAHALLPARWTCSENLWDPDRSLCSAAEELTAEQLEELVPTLSRATPKKTKVAKTEQSLVDVLGLDTLANLAIQEGEDIIPTSSQATTKHPRHRPGCTCIVCIQPPSGKGPKHKPSCECNVCQTVKRRFKTLMMKREKKQTEKEAETVCEKMQPKQMQEGADVDIHISSGTGTKSPNQEAISIDGCVGDTCEGKLSASPFKGQIDLNMQPDREEELSPGSDTGYMMAVLQDASGRYLKQQRYSSFSGNRALGGQAKHEGNGGTVVVNDGRKIADDNHITFSRDTVVSSSPNGT